MAFIDCTPADVLSVFNTDEAKYGDRQWLWDCPGNLPWYGSRNYYFCAGEVTKCLLPGRDMRKQVKTWVNCGSWYNYMAQAPASHFLTVHSSAARAGDVGILSKGNYRYHMFLVRAATRGDTLYTAEANTSSPKFPGSDSLGGVIRNRTRSIRAQTAGAYNFRIWRPGYAKGAPSKPINKDAKIAEDGDFGTKSVKALEVYFNSTDDGMISGQPSTAKPFAPRLLAVQWVAPSKSGGSKVVAKLQKRIGVRADGKWGPKTTKALQRALGVKVDGIFGPKTARALQHAINAKTL